MALAVFGLEPFVKASPRNLQYPALNANWEFKAVSLDEGILYGRAFAKYAVAFFSISFSISSSLSRFFNFAFSSA